MGDTAGANGNGVSGTLNDFGELRRIVGLDADRCRSRVRPIHEFVTRTTRDLILGAVLGRKGPALDILILKRCRAGPEVASCPGRHTKTTSDTKYNLVVAHHREGGMDIRWRCPLRVESRPNRIVAESESRPAAVGQSKRNVPATANTHANDWRQATGIFLIIWPGSDIRAEGNVLTKVIELHVHAVDGI